MSTPTSAMMVCAFMMLMPSISVRSEPLIRYNSPRRSKLLGALLPAFCLGRRRFAPGFGFVFQGLQMGRQGGVTFCDLLLIDLIQIQLLLQNEEQLPAPVASRLRAISSRVA